MELNEKKKNVSFEMTDIHVKNVESSIKYSFKGFLKSLLSKYKQEWSQIILNNGSLGMADIHVENGGKI